MRSALLRPLRLLLILQLLLCNSLCSSKKYRHYHPRRYNLTLSVRNHNVTEAKFFRLNGVGNTADFVVAPGDVFTKTYEAKRKGFWTLFVEFPGNRYSKSPKKIISRDSYNHWIMEVYYYPGAVGFSDWHRVHGDVVIDNNVWRGRFWNTKLKRMENWKKVDREQNKPGREPLRLYIYAKFWRNYYHEKVKWRRQ